MVGKRRALEQKIYKRIENIFAIIHRSVRDCPVCTLGAFYGECMNYTKFLVE